MEWYFYTTYFIYIALILGSVVGNGGFILLFVFSRKIRKAVSLFMTSLAVADLVFPAMVVPFHLQHLISGSWHHGALECRLRTFAYLVAASASILSYCCVTVERFIRIIYPMRFNMDNVKYVLVLVALLWFYSVGSSAFVFADFLDWSRTSMHGACSHALPTNLFLALFVLTYCAPLLAMFSICGCILKLSWRHRQQINHTNVHLANSTKNGNSRARKVAKQPVIMFVLLFHFVVCWLPISVFSLVLKTHYDSELDWPKWTGPLYQFFNILAFSNSVFNPIIYGYSNTHLKAALRQCILRRSAKVRPRSFQSTAFVIRSQMTTRTRANITELF